MTKQNNALRLAELLTANEWPGHVTLVSYARECVAELRRQHAEIETLRMGYEAALMYEELRAAIDGGHESMTHADALAEIAEMTAELETLRAGYAAARLEIESLRAAQPAEAQQSVAANAESGPDMRTLVAVAVTVLFDSHPDDVQRVFTIEQLTEIARTSEKLGCQQVEDIYKSAWDALYCSSLTAAASAQAAPTTQPACQQEAQEPCPSCRNSDIYACTCTFPKSRNTAPQQEADNVLGDVVALLRKYRKLCQEVGRGDSAHLDRIEAAAVAVQTITAAPAAQEGKSHDN